MGGQAQVAEQLADDVCNMSALPPVADITSLKGMSALCQKRTSGGKTTQAARARATPRVSKSAEV